MVRTRKISHQAKTERNKELVMYVREGHSFVETAKKYGITKQRVYQLAKQHNISKWKESKKYKEELATNIKKDIKDGLGYNEIKSKYNVTANYLNDNLGKYGLGGLATKYLEIRNKEILHQYKNKEAYKVITSKEPKLDDPSRVNSVNYIYAVSGKQGYRKYPKIGNRNAGGLNEDKKVIKIILEKRDLEGWTFPEITNYLNEKGFKTVMGLLYKTPNVTAKYNYLKKNSV